MSDIDPNKLKVVELRAELTQRGLDSRGNKSVLVERLVAALNKEAGISVDNENTDKEKTVDANEEESLTADVEDEEEGLDSQENNDAEPEKIEESKEAEEEEEAVKDEDEDMEKEEETKEETKDKEEKAAVLEEEPAKDNAGAKGEKRKRSPSPYHRYSDRYRRVTPSPPRHSPIREPSPDLFDKTCVGLDLNHSDLNLVIEKTHYRAEPLSEGGFAYMYAGARASYGVVSGKVAFEVKILKQVEINIASDDKEKHAFRVGFSTPATSLQLGEEELSYGYTSGSKKSTKSEFTDYGATFGPDDVVAAFLNMEDEENVEISFAKNGEHQGLAFSIPKAELGDQALYPHVLTKNCSFDINFGQEESTYASFPEGYADYELLGTVVHDKRVQAPAFPDKKEDCEIIMMCGLPGSGKTTWALKHQSENTDKYYNVLGVHSIVEKMKVNGEPRKKHYSGRWEGLIDKASLCLNKILDMASRRLRNYILDQTNTYSSAQRRKMRNFEGFKRKAIVIMPSEEEYKKRIEKQKQEDAKDISDHTIMEMKANLHFPEEGQFFDTVTYVELEKAEAEVLAKTFNEEGSNALRSHKRHRSFQDDRGRRGGYTDKRPRGGGFRPNWRQTDRRGPPGGYHYNGPRGFRDNRPPMQSYRGRRGQGYSGGYGGPSPWKPGYSWNQGGWGGYQGQHNYQYYYK